MEEASERELCGSVVVTANDGNTKGQIISVFDSTLITLYAILVINLHYISEE